MKIFSKIITEKKEIKGNKTELTEEEKNSKLKVMKNCNNKKEKDFFFLLCKQRRTILTIFKGQPIVALCFEVPCIM